MWGNGDPFASRYFYEPLYLLPEEKVAKLQTLYQKITPELPYYTLVRVSFKVTPALAPRLVTGLVAVVPWSGNSEVGSSNGYGAGYGSSLIRFSMYFQTAWLSLTALSTWLITSSHKARSVRVFPPLRSDTFCSM